jgi:hypothetical protein
LLNSATLDLVRLKTSLLLTLLGLAFTPLAHAETDTTWDFRDANMQVDAQGLTNVTKTADGLHIQTSSDGFLYWSKPFTQPVDVMTLHVIGATASDPGLIWHPLIAPAGDTTQLYFHIDPQPDLQDVNVVTNDNPLWDWHTDQFGIGFPAGTDVVLQSITLRNYSTWEKATEAWNAFWTFDQFRPYSINFLWGPLFTFNAISRAKLFDHLPPFGISADRLFYMVIGLGIVLGALCVVLMKDKKKAKRRAAAIILGTFAVVWVIFDVRMGAEILSYAFHDYNTYIAPEENAKTFRTHGSFYTIANEMMPAIMQVPRYVVVEPNDSPFYENLRYMSYPSIPMHVDQNTTGVTLWAVFQRNDVRMDAMHRLIDAKGHILSPPGHLSKDFGGGTFLFAVP